MANIIKYDFKLEIMCKVIQAGIYTGKRSKSKKRIYRENKKEKQEELSKIQHYRHLFISDKSEGAITQFLFTGTLTPFFLMIL